VDSMPGPVEFVATSRVMLNWARNLHVALAQYPPLVGPNAGTRRRQRSGLSDGGAVPGSAAASAAPPPASRQSPGALASCPPHTGRRPCVRTSLSPPASAGPSTAPGPCGCAACRARPAGSGRQQPLLHQGERLCPLAKRYPFAFWNPG
jgi:hypothetical protein